MDTHTVLRELLKQAHKWFEDTVTDVTPELAEFTPPGVAPRIGARIAHLVISEDVLINSILNGGAPMFQTTFAGKSGVSDPRFEQSFAWDRSVQVEMPKLVAYMRAVFANTHAVFEAYTADDMNRIVDMTRFGYGRVPLPIWYGIFIIAHAHDVSGEISEGKGLHGKKGYPA